MTVAPAISPTSSTRSTARRDQNVLQRLVRHRLAQIGLALLMLLLVAAFFARPIVDATVNSSELQREVARQQKLAKPQDTRALMSYSKGIKPVTGEPHTPDATFLLGADTLGRDVWTRVLYGARLSLQVGFFAMLSSVLIGTTVDLISGYFGGWIDGALMRLTDIVLSLPTVLLVIAFVAVLPTDAIDNPLFRFHIGAETLDRRVFNLLFVIGLVTWTRIARAVRGEVLSLKGREFIEAARATGGSHGRIIWKHLLPNVIPTVIVLATLATANNILLEAGLSYLGLGVEPETPSWGGMIAEGQPYLLSAPWITLAPGVAIVLAVAAFNLLGQALQEILEPRA